MALHGYGEKKYDITTTYWYSVLSPQSARQDCSLSCMHGSIRSRYTAMLPKIAHRILSLHSPHKFTNKFGIHRCLDITTTNIGVVVSAKQCRMPRVHSYTKQTMLAPPNRLEVYSYTHQPAAYIRTSAIAIHASSYSQPAFFHNQPPTSLTSDQCLQHPPYDVAVKLYIPATCSCRNRPP